MNLTFIVQLSPVLLEALQPDLVSDTSQELFKRWTSHFYNRADIVRL